MVRESPRRRCDRGPLLINAVVYAEFSVGFVRVEDVDRVLDGARFEMADIPRAALFLAGKVFQRHRAQGGTRTGVLPNFFIGGRASPVTNTRSAPVQDIFFRTHAHCS